MGPEAIFSIMAKVMEKIFICKCENFLPFDVKKTFYHLDMYVNIYLLALTKGER